MAIRFLLAALWGYILGSVPTGFLVCRALGKGDIRDQGSRHTGGLNVCRLAGIPGGALTALVDFSLGAAAAVGARQFLGDSWAGAVAGTMAVAGHNWSVFIGFKGGIGLSTLAGAMLSSFSFPVLPLLVSVVAAWVFLVLLLHVHRARATILVMLAVGPLAWLFSLPPSGVLLGTLGGIGVILKTLPDWHRRYT